MSNQNDDNLRDRLLHLAGRVDALTEAADILNAELEKALSVEELPDNASLGEQVARLRGDVRLAEETLTGTAERLSALGRQAAREFAELKAKTAPGQSFKLN